MNTMNMHKTCPVCGKEFTTAARGQKYCSIDCRAIGSRRVREEWESRTDYKTKNRDRMREVRSHADAVRTSLQAQQNAERAAEHQARMNELHAQRSADLERRASNGDIFAQMQLAMINRNPIEYWRLYREYVISEDVRNGTYPRWGCHYVGGIDVYEDNFEYIIGTL